MASVRDFPRQAPAPAHAANTPPPPPQAGEPDRAPATGRRGVGPWLAPRLETIAAGFAAAIPVIVAGAHALRAGWQPGADQAIIVTRAYDVFTSHAPGVGQYSLAGINGGVIHSPGPMLYWLLAIPARFGAPSSVVWTMTAVNALCIVGCVVLARRRGGRVLMFAAAIALALMCQSLAAETFHDVWNPSAALFPFTLLIFLSWSLACGEYRLLPLTAVVASFVAQAHLAYVAPTAGLLAIGLGGLLLRRTIARRRRPGGGDELAAGGPSRALPGRSHERHRVWPWALAAVLLASVCWAPAVIDQIDGHPGNLGLLYRTATSSRATVGAGVGRHAVVRAVGLRPWWLYVPGTRWDRKYDVRATPGTLATDTCLALLAGLLLAALIGAARRRPDVTAAAAVGLVLCAALGEVAAHTPTARVQAATLGYTMWWGSQVGMWVWLTLAWSLGLGAQASARALARRVRATWRLGAANGARIAASVALGLAGVGAAAATGSAVAATEKPDEHVALYRPIQSLAARVDQAIPRGSTVLLLGDLDVSTMPVKPALRYYLVRHGVRPLATDSYQRLGSWYELYRRRYQYVAYVGFRARPPRRGLPPAQLTLAARASYRDGWGAHTVSVWVGRAAPGS